MTTLTPQNFESVMDRPSDQPWTPEQNARYAAARAETIRLAQQRADAKPIKTYYLANDHMVVTFWIDAGKGEAEVAFRYRLGSRKANDPEIMTIREAREKWLELVEAGYAKW